MALIYRHHTPTRCSLWLTAEQSDTGMRLDQFMHQFIPGVSRRHIQQNIVQKTIVRTNRPGRLKASSVIQEGDVLYMATHIQEFPVQQWAGAKLPQAAITDIMYEDSHFIVINKPPFMSTYPTGPHLFYCATVHLEAMDKGTMHTVHRLDRETSGILVMAKTSARAQQLTQLFEQHKAIKTYLLIVQKPATPIEFPITINQRLGMVEGFIPRLKMHCFAPESSQGKKSRTDFYKVHDLPHHLILLAQPQTGRQHQIRAHAAYMGCPLLGDKLYQKDPMIFTRFSEHKQTQQDYIDLGLPRHALHAYHLQLHTDPSRNFTSLLPGDMHAWLEDHLDIPMRALQKKMDQTLESILA